VSDLQCQAEWLRLWYLGWEVHIERRIIDGNWFKEGPDCLSNPFAIPYHQAVADARRANRLEYLGES
jgi:hypothetical protein